MGVHAARSVEGSTSGLCLDSIVGLEASRAECWPASCPGPAREVQDQHYIEVMVGVFR